MSRQLQFSGVDLHGSPYKVNVAEKLTTTVEIEGQFAQSANQQIVHAVSMGILYKSGTGYKMAPLPLDREVARPKLETHLRMLKSTDMDKCRVVGKFVEAALMLLLESSIIVPLVGSLAALFFRLGTYVNIV